jgi:uncharacterized membrane protein
MVNHTIVIQLKNLTQALFVEPVKAFYKNIKQDNTSKVLACVAITSGLIIIAAVALPFIAPSLGIGAGSMLGIAVGGMLGMHISNFATKIYDKFTIKAQIVRDDFSVASKTLNSLDVSYKETILELIKHFKNRAQTLFDKIDEIRSKQHNAEKAVQRLIRDINKISEDWQTIKAAINTTEFSDKAETYLRERYQAERAELLEPNANNPYIPNKGIYSIQFARKPALVNIYELHNLKEKLDKVKQSMRV